MLVPRSVLDEVGGFDERYFLFWEDADWCRRIADAGYEVWTVPAAVVVHDEGGSRKGWPAPVVRSFHRGAYRYWATHVAPQAWNPLRWLAAAALAGRAGVLILRRVGTRSGMPSRRSVEDRLTPLPTNPVRMSGSPTPPPTQPRGEATWTRTTS
jgi:GT2 family glycosyltransferase